MVDFTIIIGGEAGFGIMTTGAMFSRIATRSGYDVFDYVQYPSLIRGGHNAYLAHVSEKPTQTMNPVIDYLICLNKDTYEKHKLELDKESVIVYDKDEFIIEDAHKLVHVPMKTILKELQGESVMKNTIALGAILALMGSDLSILNDIIKKQFAKKGESVVKFNRQFAEKGYTHVMRDYAQYIKKLLVKKQAEEKMVISGNEAFSLGAAIADCRIYVAYPMTPSSTVLTQLAAWQNKTGMVVRHAEDEISVINTAIGASFAGARSAVGTSGGGFALMVESISLAGITETPIVIFLAQRPGPATGMPTWTGQGDLLFAVHAGHGEFPKIVLAPGDMQEMIELSAEAFNLADIYQLPVVVVSDMLLSESHASILRSTVDAFIKKYVIKRGKTVNTPSEVPYLRYKISDDGISERLIPGFKGAFYQANSYEHVEDGHTTEEAEPRILQAEKRTRKIQTYFKSDFKKPEVIGDVDNASVVFVSWGSGKGVLLHAQELLAEQSIKSAIMHFTYMYPLSEALIAPLFQQGKRYILVEGNEYGQFGKLLRMETGIDLKEKILRYDGRPLTATEIVDHVMKRQNSL